MIKTKKITVVCGENKIALDMNDEEITIYVGDFVKDAPEGSTYSQIGTGYTKFMIIDRDED